MSHTTEYQRSLNGVAIHKSFFLPSTVKNQSMNNNKHPMKTFCTRYRWMILVLTICLLLAIILTTVLVIETKQNAHPVLMNQSNISFLNEKHHISIKGLLTIDTITNLSICDKNQTIEDCVLLYNSKIIMSALLLIPSPTSNNSSISLTFPGNSSKTTVDCKSLRIRRNQLPEIFDSHTLETIYNLSGLRYTPSNTTISSNPTDTRSQIDGRSIQSRWTSPINYYISTTTGLTQAMIDTIRLAISNWANNTCLVFNELTDITPTTNKSYLYFQRDDDYGCSSPVGYDKSDPTSVILLASSCGRVIGTVMHEIGHSLGYIHTQSRIDRNSYVRIATENIDQDYIGNFFMWIYGTIRFLDVLFPYDFGSFMHYEAFGFTINGLPTIVALDDLYERTMGQRERASFYDYKQMNRLYCTRTTCPQMFTGNSCQNNGYLDPQTCTRCICPDGFSGTSCEQRDSLSNCGDTIVNPTPNSPTQITIQNPVPTSTTATQQYCVFLIQSQTAGKIRFRLDSINTLRRSVCSLSSSIEVKYQSDLAVTGARWCGNNVTSPWLNITAQSNTMLVIFRANNYINRTTGTAQTGFRATIFFDAEPSPVTATTLTSTLRSTVLSTLTTNTLTTTTTRSSTCPPSSYRCRLPSQPTCGGCLNFQPCTTQGTQQCTAFAYQIQLTDCDKIINGIAQCRYQFIQTPYTTSCQRTILLCCPNYQLISFQSNYFCIYNPQAINPTEWSAVL